MIHSLSLAIWRYSIEPRIRKDVKGYGFLLFARKYKKQLLDTGVEFLKCLEFFMLDFLIELCLS